MSYNINEPNIWFFQTIEERNVSGTPRMRMLPGQKVRLPDGTWEDCDVKLNVQSDTKPRNENSVGTIFASKSLEKGSTPGKELHYSAGSKTLITIGRGVSADINQAYQDYMAAMGSPIGAAATAAATSSGPKAKTLIEKLVDEFPAPTVAKDNFYVDAELWRCLLFNIHQGYNTMLVGESGTGKTELTMLLAKTMNKAISIFDMAAKQDPIASLVGVHRFEDGKSVFDRADFTYEIEKDTIVVLDELPRAPMNTNNILFPVLDSRKELKMDIASAALRAVKVNPLCRFIATANEGFKYTGNNVLDQALKERFQILVIDFMPQAQEVSLLEKRTGVTRANAEVIVKVSRTIRERSAKDELTNGVSVRHSLYAADLCAGGFAVVKAMECAFLPMYSIEEERKAVKDILAAR